MRSNSKRCLICKRLLIKESVICTRCFRTGRNKGGKAVIGVGLGAGTIFGIRTLVSNAKTDDSDGSDEIDEE